MKIRYGAEARMCTRKRDFRTNEIVLDTLNKKIKDINDDRNNLLEVVDKMLKPLGDLPAETIQKILDGKFKTKTLLACDIYPFTKKFGWYIELTDDDLGYKFLERW